MSETLTRDFVIGAEIGRGRFGTVHHCTSVTTGEHFAVKSISKSAISDPIDLACIESEAKFTLLVSDHPHIVSLHRTYDSPSSLHLVLDLCSASDLHHLISTAHLTEPEAVALMRPLMDAIAHCHRKGVAHRDVKPENVLFDANGRLRLADLGSAAWFGDGRRMEGLVGTPYYVAPEVLAGRDYGEKVDVWSAGVVLYVMLSGTLPFYGDSVEEVFEKVSRGNLRFPTRVFRGVSPAAKDLIRKMVCRDESRRFSAEQVLRHPWMMNEADSSDESS